MRLKSLIGAALYLFLFFKTAIRNLNATALNYFPLTLGKLESIKAVKGAKRECKRLLLQVDFLAYEIKHLEHREKARRQLFLGQVVQWNSIIFDVLYIIGRMGIPMYRRIKCFFKKKKTRICGTF